MKRLGVLGTLVWDTIWHPAGEADAPREQWGGLAYSLAAFSACGPAGWAVEPVVKVGADLAGSARELMDSLPGISPGRGVRVVPEATNRVELRYRDAAHRHERLTGGVPGWGWEELEPLVAPLDALYVNFISGFEMPLAVARRLRAGFRGPIYADLHSLFLDPPGQGARRPRPLPDWREWLACFDFVQLNDAELRLLAGDGDPEDLLPRLPALGPRLVLVTRGGEGASYVEGAGPVRHAPVPGGALPGDPTGCGDVWGSAACCALLEGLPAEAAVALANRLAARKLRSPGLASLPGALRS